MVRWKLKILSPTIAPPPRRAVAVVARGQPPAGLSFISGCKKTRRKVYKARGKSVVFRERCAGLEIKGNCNYSPRRWRRKRTSARHGNRESAVVVPSLPPSLLRRDCHPRPRRRGLREKNRERQGGPGGKKRESREEGGKKWASAFAAKYTVTIGDSR